MDRFTKHSRAKLLSIEKGLKDLRADPDFKVSYDEDPLVCDLVLAGGGAKGVAHLGALWALDILGIRIKRLAGNSAGAIIAAFLAAGYSVDELIDDLFNIDFLSFRDGFWDQRLPKFALIATISTTFGLYEGNKLQAWIEEGLVRKHANTFGRLPRSDVGMLSKIKPSDGNRLTIIASDITHSKDLILPDEIKKEMYGRLRVGSFPISAAVRMSIAVPFFFTPYKLNNSLIVDGAFASNLPIEIFDRDDPCDVRWPTLGINLVSDPTPGHPPDDLFHFGLSIFDTMRYGQSKMSTINYPTRICRIIEASTQEVKTLDFDIKREQKERLFVNGARAVLDTLKGVGDLGLRSVWNFDSYLKLRKRWSFPPSNEKYFQDPPAGDTGGGGI